MNIYQIRIFGFMILPVHILIIIIALNNVSRTSHGVWAIALTAISLGLSIVFYIQMTTSLKLSFIEKYQFPNIVIKKFRSEHKYLSDDDVEKVILGLKQFFYIYQDDAVAPGKDGFMMPSRIVDELWHHFMLDSANYYEFCDQAFGKTLHHKPGMDTGGNKKLHLMKEYPKSLYNTYQAVQSISKDKTHYFLNGVPILFALDAYLNIDNGFYYNDIALQNIDIAMRQNTTSTSDSGGSSGACGGIIASDTISSCGSSDSGGSCGGGCGGGGGD